METQQKKARNWWKIGLLTVGGAGVLLVGSCTALVGVVAVAGSDSSGDTAAQGTSGNSSGTGSAKAEKTESRQAAKGDDQTSGVAVVTVEGTPGIRFEGDIGNMDVTRSVQGVTPATYEVEYDPDPWNMDMVYVDFYKAMDANANYDQGTVKVAVTVDGKVVQESQSSAQDGYVSISWGPE